MSAAEDVRGALEHRPLAAPVVPVPAPDAATAAWRAAFETAHPGTVIRFETAGIWQGLVPAEANGGTEVFLVRGDWDGDYGGGLPQLLADLTEAVERESG